MKDLSLCKQLEDLTEQIFEEAEQVYAQLNSTVKSKALTKEQKDRVLGYVYAKIKSLGVKLLAICNQEKADVPQPYENDEQLGALFFLKNAINGPTAKANPLLKAYLEDLFYCLEDDVSKENPRRVFPMWVHEEGLRITGAYLDETTKRENQYARQRRKDLKKRGRR